VQKCTPFFALNRARFEKNEKTEFKTEKHAGFLHIFIYCFKRKKVKAKIRDVHGFLLSV